MEKKDKSAKLMPRKKVNVPKKDLKKLYEKEKLTTYEIAKLFNCCQATIWKRLHEFKIKPRKPMIRNARVPSRKILVKLYIKKRLSTWEIERKYGYSRGTVHRKLKEYKLIRSRAESHLLYPRKSFSNNIIEKAYLIGFRLGDLRVRKIHPNSETINVGCGSTKIEQINLIKNLFNRYGNVWTSKPKNKKINIEVGLDTSFSFLLEKKYQRGCLERKSILLLF